MTEESTELTPGALLILNIYKACREVSTGRTPKTSIQVLQDIEKMIETAYLRRTISEST